MECEKCNDYGFIFEPEMGYCDCLFGMARIKDKEAEEISLNSKLKTNKIKIKPIERQIKTEHSVCLTLENMETIIDLSLAIKNEELFMRYTKMKMEMMK